MVNYDNPELFYEHETTHLIIVNSGAVITAVEGDEPDITGATFTLTEDDVSEDEIELRESLCSADNLKFGSMEASCFRVDIFDSSDIPYLKDEEIDVYVYFNEDSSTLFKIGRYIVNEDVFSDDRLIRTITAYDLINYLRGYDITEWYNSVYEDAETRTIKYLRDSLFEWLSEDMEDYTIEQEDVELINDDWLVEYSIESDTITFGFFMQGIAEFNGVFPHIDRNGKFRYVGLEWYDKPAVKKFDDELTIPPVRYGGAGKDITVWGIGYVVVYDRNNKKLAKVGSSNRKYPSNYKIIDSFVITNNLKRTNWKDDLEAALYKLREKITHLRYKPFEGGFYGNLCWEVGDRIDVSINTYDEESDYADDETPIVKEFYTYILERTFSGLNEFDDIYIARGNKKQPVYQIRNDKWHIGDSNLGTNNPGAISSVTDNFDKEFIEKIRNIGFRLLDEPTDVSVEYDETEGSVKIMWTDPDDITDSKPVEAKWAGTVVVRTENYPPKHRWEQNSELICDSTTKNEYSVSELVDDTVEADKRYYYGIFPYDFDGIVRHYRWTKIISVDTSKDFISPEIHSAVATGVSVTVNYYLPTGSYASRKIVYKANYIPESATDGQSYNIGAGAGGEGHSPITGLQPNTLYYFIIYDEDSNHRLATSNVVQCTTGSVLGLFNYNGVAMDSRLAYSSAIKASQGYSQFNYYNNNEYLGYTSGNLYNVGIAFGTPFTRGNYKRVCAEIEIPTGANWGSPNPPGGYLNHSEMIALGAKPNTNFTSFFENWLAWTKCTDFETMTNYSKTTPWSTMPRTVVKMDITRIASDRQFYLAFFKCDCTMKIYRIWFES